MRNRNWSDLVMAAMIGLCVAAVAEPYRQAQVVPAAANIAANDTEVGDAARSLAIAVLLGPDQAEANARHTSQPATESATDRAMSNAAAAAGHVARDIEMPFFSFGGDASAE